WASKDIQNSIWAPKNRKELPIQEKIFVEQEKKFIDMRTETGKNLSLHLNLTVWDLPTDTTVPLVKKYMGYYGKVTVERWREIRRNRAVYLSIECWNQQRYEQLKESWVIQLEGGKMCRVIAGFFNEEILESRRKYS